MPASVPTTSGKLLRRPNEYAPPADWLHPDERPEKQIQPEALAALEDPCETSKVSCRNGASTSVMSPFGQRGLGLFGCLPVKVSVRGAGVNSSPSAV